MASDRFETPAHAVDRAELRALLDLGVTHPLTLVVAPAGSGKTVLLAQWASARPERATAWVDIRPGDADPLAFAGRLVAAIRGVAPDVAAPRAAVDTPFGRLGEPFLEALASELDGAGELVVVFDDLHRLAEPLLDDLWRLADLIPANAHLVFSSRIDLGLPWSRHRLQHGLVEIRQEELAFDAPAVAALLRQLLRGPVSEEVAARVLDRTEGWAAGVQLTGLILRSSRDQTAFLERIADPHRLVVDYLSEEILDDQDPLRRRALLRLSVLDAFDPGLAEAVGGAESGAELLAALERESMFVVPVPARSGWFRFHHLFREVLLHKLRAEGAEDESELLRAGSDYLISCGDLDAAIEALLRARAWDRVLDLLLTAAGRDIYEQVRTPTIARWLAAVPADVLAERPPALLLRAITEGMSGRAAVTAAIMRDLLAAGTLTDGERQVAKAYLATLVQFLPHTDVYRDVALDSLADLAEHPDAEPPDLMGLTSRGFLSTLSHGALGRAHLLLGDGPARSRPPLITAMRSDAGSYPPYRAHGIGSLAIIDGLAGRLRAATELADEALLICEEAGLMAHHSSSDAFLGRAIIAIQRGRPEVGAVALAEGYLRAASNQRTQLMWIAHAASLLIDPQGTDPAAVEPPGPPPMLVRRILRGVRMRAMRLQGEPVEVGPIPSGVWTPVVFEQIAALLTNAEADRAFDALGSAAIPPVREAPVPAVEHALLTAWAHSSRGRADLARQFAARAVEIAEPEGYVHAFIRIGPAAAALLESLPGASEFRSRLVEAIRGPAGSPAVELTEPLTAREREILAFLPSRWTVADIARHCYVSANTVKTHMAHIYRKLDATGRDDAIARARSLGLLPAGQIAPVG